MGRVVRVRRISSASRDRRALRINNASNNNAITFNKTYIEENKKNYCFILITVLNRDIWYLVGFIKKQ